MNNFQLYRTNPALSGQVKWDLVLNSSNSELYISDFHITPISNDLNYIHDNEEYLLNRTHQDNIKLFYKENSDIFYSNGITSNFEHSYPIICNENDHPEIYFNSYDMCCKRSKDYSIYNKQFEFLCPLWLEHLDKDISFVISVYHVGDDTSIASRMLKLKVINDDVTDFHDKFITYFKNYIKDSNILNGNDNILNISFDKKSTNINGLHVKSGKFTTENIPFLIDNLLFRERSLLETDSMILNSFKDNLMICNQLINLNFCFNISDIVSNSIMKMLHSINVRIKVDAYIGDELIEKRDFYTDYDFIEKEFRTTPNNEKDMVNVLDYLKDNRCLELIDKNKFCQSICHWSLAENTDYIFNVYDGFSGVYKDDDGHMYENHHHYGFSTNLNTDNYSNVQNTCGWLNTYDIKTWNTFMIYIKATKTYLEHGVYVDRNNNFINGIKYDFSKLQPDFNLFGKYMIGMVVSNTLMLSISKEYTGKYEFEKIYDNKSQLYIMEKDNLIFLISTDKNNFVFNNFYNILKSVLGKNNKHSSVLRDMHNLLESAVSPSLIIFENSIKYSSADGPNTKIEEITYYNDNSSFNYVFRYDGKIKPAFTTKRGALYYKDYLFDSDMSKYKDTSYYKFGNIGYEPLYPSIGYCGIKKIDLWRYDELPKIKISESNEDRPLFDNMEYTWFDINSFIVVNPKISFSYINKDGAEELKDIIFDYIKKFYNVSEESKIDYIMSLYECENNWEYLSDTNINDYIYNITLKLK